MTVVPKTRGSWLEAPLFFFRHLVTERGRIFTDILNPVPWTSPSFFCSTSSPLQSHFQVSTLLICTDLFPELFKCPMKIFFPPSVIMHPIAGKCLSNQPAKQHGVVRRINREDWVSYCLFASLGLGFLFQSANQECRLVLPLPEDWRYARYYAKASCNPRLQVTLTQHPVESELSFTFIGEETRLREVKWHSWGHA